MIRSGGEFVQEIRNEIAQHHHVQKLLLLPTVLQIKM